MKTGKTLILLTILLLTGCSDAVDDASLQNGTPAFSQPEDPLQGRPPFLDEVDIKPSEPMVAEVNWSDDFEGFNGAAVIYHPLENKYEVYNQELADTRRSPCSTFKIISSLVALEHGIIQPDNSMRAWSGEAFWKEEWNQNIDFSGAFRTSCVWYFRQVIDDIGGDVLQSELERLQYGNCDISDWEGRLNTNNNNRALTGFWIESSLKISPKEQTEVMERIFGSETVYQEESLRQLKEVMLVTGEETVDIPIYGKTGMGKAKGVVVDSWYTGVADLSDEEIYFCVYLGETEGKDVSSAKAKEIAIRLITNSQQ